ncbi:MAG: hypothetical protein KJZ54_07855 [Phycisphaerales bacterium]|nr:hypothetical protein [Phycisphaerales bacterium]
MEPSEDGDGCAAAHGGVFGGASGVAEDFDGFASGGLRGETALVGEEGVDGGARAADVGLTEPERDIDAAEVVRLREGVEVGAGGVEGVEERLVEGGEGRVGGKVELKRGIGAARLRGIKGGNSTGGSAVHAYRIASASRDARGRACMSENLRTAPVDRRQIVMDC